MNEAREYLEKWRLADSHWGKRIIDAESRGGFDKQDRGGAGEWFTCACGMVDDWIERDEEGAPTDAKLEGLGVDFYDYICDDDYLAAAETLYNIQHRAGELQ